MMRYMQNASSISNVGNQARETTRPVSAKARKLIQDQHNGRPVWIRSPNPMIPEFVFIIMITMLIVKFAIILFGR